jgi:hypothetical protein
MVVLLRYQQATNCSSIPRCGRVLFVVKRAA